MDDSFAGGLTLEGSLIRELDDKTSVAIGLNYAISAEKRKAYGDTEEVERKTLGVDISAVREYGNTRVMATIGAYNNRSAERDSSNDTQVYEDEVKYIGLVANHKIDESYSIGGSYAKFKGMVKRENYGVYEDNKKLKTWSLYGQYKQDDYALRVGYRDYRFDDVSDDEWLESDALFVELSYKFGNASERSYMLINEKPDYLTYGGVVAGTLE